MNQLIDLITIVLISIPIVIMLGAVVCTLLGGFAQGIRNYLNTNREP